MSNNPQPNGAAIFFASVGTETPAAPVFNFNGPVGAVITGNGDIGDIFGQGGDDVTILPPVLPELDVEDGVYILGSGDNAVQVTLNSDGSLTVQEGTEIYGDSLTVNGDGTHVAIGGGDDVYNVDATVAEVLRLRARVGELEAANAAFVERLAQLEGQIVATTITGTTGEAGAAG